MANASKDQNGVNSLIVGLDTDGVTIVRIKADPTDHVLEVSDGTTGTDHGPVNDLRDANNVPALLAVSSTDGLTPVVIYGDSSGNLLIKST